VLVPPPPWQAYVKYNQSITHNKALREQINNLRRERLMFESIHSNLERELAKLKKDMADTIQLANQVGGDGCRGGGCRALTGARTAGTIWQVQSHQGIQLSGA
jgi:hypothetical protein